MDLDDGSEGGFNMVLRGFQRAAHYLDGSESSIPVAVEIPQNHLILGEYSLCIRKDS